MNNKSMNNEKVVIRKKAIGVVAEFGGSSTETIIEGDTLVEQVCDSFKQGINTGKWGPADSDTCECKYDNKVSACIIAGADPNNWLKYDGVEWRVLGLYDIHNDGTRLSAKMITHQTVDVQ